MQTTKPNETKLALVQVTFYVIQPGNELGLFYTGPRTHTGRSYFFSKDYDLVIKKMEVTREYFTMISNILKV